MKVVIIMFFFINLMGFSSEEDYLKSHVKQIDLKEYHRDNFTYLDGVESKVFFSGEYHGIKENYKIRLQLIKYFYEEYGVRKYMGELGYSSGYFLNKYLQTGEEKYLDIINYSLEGSYDFSEEDYEFWQALYRYNKELPEDKKIKIYGLDVDMQYWIPVLAINDILNKLDMERVDPKDRDEIIEVKSLFQELSDAILPPDTDPKDIYENVRKVVKEKALIDRRKEVIDVFKMIRLNFLLNKSSVEKYYSKEEIIDIEAIVYNALNTIDFLRFRKNKEISFHIREKFIFENFIRLFKSFPEDKFYGQWGRFHISEREGSDEVRFVQLVEDFAPDFYKSITAVEFIYNDKKHSDYRKKGVKKKLRVLRKYIPEDSDAAIFDMRNLPRDSDLLDKRERRYIKYIIVINSPTKTIKLK